MANNLNVYLLNVGPQTARRVFYAETPEVGADAPLPGGLRGWAESKLRRIKGRWQHSRSHAASFSRRVWEWLHSRTHPDETLLAQLRSAGSLTVHYPAPLGSDGASAAWEGFLAVARRRHWGWFVANALVAPLSIVLAPLPGPNLLGYWFAYRALHHWLILIGLGRVRRGLVETLFRPVDGPDGPILPGHLDLEAVGEFLERHGARPDRAGPPRAVTPSPGV